MTSRIPFLISVIWSACLSSLDLVASLLAGFVPAAGSVSTGAGLFSGALCAVDAVPAVTGSSPGSGLIGPVLGSRLASGAGVGAGAASDVSHESRIECSLLFKSSAALLMT